MNFPLSPMQAKLLVTKDGTVVREVTLKPTTTVGRSNDSDLCIRSSLVSRDHCVVFEHQGALVVKDLGSTNGTFVNGSSVTEQVLSPGDELTIGQVHFRVEYEPAKGAMLTPRAAKPSPAAAAVFDADDSTILEAEAVDVREVDVLEAEVVVDDDGEALEAIEAVPVDVLDEVDDADFLDPQPVESPSGAGSARSARALDDDDDDDDDLDEFLSRLGQH